MLDSGPSACQLQGISVTSERVVRGGKFSPLFSLGLFSIFLENLGQEATSVFNEFLRFRNNNWVFSFPFALPPAPDWNRLNAINCTLLPPRILGEEKEKRNPEGSSLSLPPPPSSFLTDCFAPLAQARRDVSRFHKRNFPPLRRAENQLEDLQKRDSLSKVGSGRKPATSATWRQIGFIGLWIDGPLLLLLLLLVVTRLLFLGNTYLHWDWGQRNKA